MSLYNAQPPDLPYELIQQKYNEYAEFSDMHFDFSLTYDELITIRNSLISSRPEWMNQEEFINYENATFLYYTTKIDSEKWWAKYEENKRCPCRK